MAVERIFTKEFFDNELEKGSLFLWEKYLDRLPEDWIDCIMFIKTEGLNEELQNAGTIILDDEASKKLFEAIEKESLELFVLCEDKKRMWNVLLTKEKNEKTNEYVKLFIGGENLRKFCDEKNIYYKTKQDRDGVLISGTNMLWQKEPGEDCRIPFVTQV